MDCPNLRRKVVTLVFNREWNRHQANLLSGAAMKQFITVTHQRYYDTFQKAGEEGVFGTTIQGIFTDEPGIMYYQGDKSFQRVIPYTSEMDAEYQKQYGKSLLTGLPPVFFEVLSTTPEFRMNFWHLASQLYANAFYKQIGKWCEEHHIAFMGHVANEGNLFNQIRDQIDYFRNAQYMSFGCCDQLGSIFRAEFEKKYTVH